LIEILNRELRAVGIGPNLQSQVKENQVGKTIQSGEFKISGWSRGGKAIESYSQLVRDIGIEGMVFCERSQVKLGGRHLEESRQVRGVVYANSAVINVPAAQLIFRRNVVIHGGGQVLEVGIVWSLNGNCTYVNRRESGRITRIGKKYVVI